MSEKFLELYSALYQPKAGDIVKMCKNTQIWSAGDLAEIISVTKNIYGETICKLDFNNRNNKKIYGLGIWYTTTTKINFKVVQISNVKQIS